MSDTSNQNYLFDDSSEGRPVNPYQSVSPPSSPLNGQPPSQPQGQGTPQSFGNPYLNGNPYQGQPPTNPYNPYQPSSQPANPYAQTPPANPYQPGGWPTQNGQPNSPLSGQPSQNPYQANLPPYASQPPANSYEGFRQWPQSEQNTQRRVVWNRTELSKPRWTYILAGVIVAVFVGQVVTGAGLLNYRTDKLFQQGALYQPLVLDGQWWRIITPMFLHLGLLHILFNTMALIAFGTQLEQWVGAKRFLIIYFLTGIAGNLATLLFADPATYSAGASGAIFGVLGAAIGFFYRNRDNLPGYGRAVLQNLLINAGLNIVFTFSIPGISITAHLGGLVVGLVLGYLLSPLHVRKTLPTNGSVASTSRARDLVLEWWPVVAVIAVEIVAYYLVMQGTNFAG